MKLKSIVCRNGRMGAMNLRSFDGWAVFGENRPRMTLAIASQFEPQMDSGEKNKIGITATAQGERLQHEAEKTVMVD